MFQHTAARRRLLIYEDLKDKSLLVSTHSRPKAAAGVVGEIGSMLSSFNTQPPEGGCINLISIGKI